MFTTYPAGAEPCPTASRRRDPAPLLSIEQRCRPGHRGGLVNPGRHAAGRSPGLFTNGFVNSPDQMTNGQFPMTNDGGRTQPTRIA